ncbi:MAG: hypothetical protein U0931_18465 [Vulcanimicrobiota bacterium]
MRRVAAVRGVRDFWLGRGFSGDEVMQMLCYSLSEVAVRLLLDTHGDFARFLQTAQMLDCGQKACRQVFGNASAPYWLSF